MGDKVIGRCNPACTRVIKFMTDREVGANSGVNSFPYTSVDGFRFLNVFVEHTQTAYGEPGVELGVSFGFDADGMMHSRHHVNFEENLSSPQTPNYVLVSASGNWSGSPHNVSHYAARFPVMGPFVVVFASNRAALARKVSVWGYAVS